MISGTLNQLLREKLEELCQLALEREHIATRRANELEDRIEKAIEYMKDFTFEPLLVNEDRKLIMFNENLREFEKILKGEE